MKKSLLSLVVLVSMLFSFQGFSQTPKLLTFSNSYGVGEIHGYDPIKDLGEHNVSVDNVNVGDTLFYLKFEYNDTYTYYGIIKSKENLNSNNYYPVIGLTLHLEISDIKDTTDNLVLLNGNDFKGIANDHNLSASNHFRKDTIINTSQSITTLSFNVLEIGPNANVDFKFSFKFDAGMYTGFEDNFFVEKETFKVYPNPCENQLNIEADGLKRIFDMNGRLMLETYENTVNMSDLAPGMYVVMLESGARAKFVKE